MLEALERSQISVALETEGNPVLAAAAAPEAVIGKGRQAGKRVEAVSVLGNQFLFQKPEILPEQGCAELVFPQMTADAKSRQLVDQRNDKMTLDP